MANWLDKYEQGGLVLKKKTKDNFGKRENANEGRSTAGPGWVGEGTTNRGFNYNGAWGGTMQMGGSLPGAVGFTYARTAGSAPANGKYTKKTKASAQNGITTNIEAGTINPTAQLTTLAKEAERKVKEKAKDKAIVADRKKRIAASVAAKKQPFSAQQLADVTQATGDKFRLFPNDPDSFIDEYINPGVFIGNLASGMGRVPLDIQQGNYGKAALNVAMPAMIGAGEVIAAPYLKQAGKYLTENTALKNAYKYNPLAFKPKADAYYRMVGEGGYADALKSGVVRPPIGLGHTEAYYNKGYPLDTRFRNATGRAGYEGPYMAEVKGNSELFVNENTQGFTGPMFEDPIVYSKQNIPIDKQDVKFYKENWLKGYKEVPKKEEGGWLNKYK